jgi:hypothetical protein
MGGWVDGWVDGWMDELIIMTIEYCLIEYKE